MYSFTYVTIYSVSSIPALKQGYSSLPTFNKFQLRECDFLGSRTTWKVLAMTMVLSIIRPYRKLAGF